MKIIKFTANNIYSRFDFNIEFNKGITFVTGINGGGKTTALKAMTSVLKPDLEWLAKTEFESLKVYLEHKKSDILISVNKESDGFLEIVFQEGKDKTKWRFHKNYVLQNHDEEIFFEDFEDFEDFHDEAKINKDGDLALLKIQKLPTPMFLGLKRIASNSGVRRRRSSRQTDWERRQRMQQPTDLRSALSLAENAAKQMEVKHTQLTSELRANLILATFDKGNTSRPDPQTTIFAENFVDIIEQYRNSLIPVLEAIGISSENIDKKVNAFFERSIEDVKYLKSRNITSFSITEGAPQGVFDRLVRLLGDLPTLQTIMIFQTLIEAYNSEKDKIFEKKNRYIHILNSFLTDSSKVVSVNEVGEVKLNYIDTKNLKNRKRDSIVNPAHLSSGERQILVLISHLIFNEATNSANIVIIDEPELSLHLAWQEMFCDAVLQADGKVQAILATHSPEIIGDRVKLCRDI